MTESNAKNHLTKGASGHQTTSALLKRLIREGVKPYRGWIALALVCMGIMAAATAASAYLLDPVFNQVFAEKRYDLLWPVAIAIILVFLIKGAANYAQATLMARVGLRIVADQQAKLFAHLAQLDLAFFHNHPTGQLISRFMNDVNAIRGTVSNMLTSLGKDLLSLVGLVTVMVIQDFGLALIAIIIFPIAIYPIVRIGRRMRKVSANTQEELSQFTTLLDQTFQGMRVVKSYGMEDYEKSRANSVIDRVFALTFKADRTRALSHPIMETLGGLAVATVVVYGGYQIIDGRMDTGSLVSFIAALLMAYEPMKRLANLNAHLQQGLAAAQRMFDMMDVESSITEKPDAKPIKISGGEVVFDQVNFSYDADSPTLSDLSLNVPAGKTVALVGPSGAGKSTILNLIPRFYDITGGKISIDGQDIRDATLASLHAACALVSQEIMLFDDTIRANIAYGRAGASEADIVKAAQDAAAHDFILELPQGYDTMVGEHGVKLSGGQRQRLAIARAMLKDAPILLLDEATSALDTESERQVQTALTRLMRDRTTIVIAHRLSTVVDADTIHVIDRGRLAESGTHDDLLAKGGHYAKLYALQFADEAVRTEAQAPSPEPETPPVSS